MKKIYLIFALVSASIISKAQYCTNGPTTADDGNIGAVTLNGNTTNISFTGSCSATGVEDLTATQSADLAAGSSYSLSIEHTSCSAFNFSGAGSVWIDWDGDGNFEAGEVIGTWLAPPSQTYTFSFTIPSYVCNGATRIRFMEQDGGALPLNPCASFSEGSVIDAEVVLSGGTCQEAGCMNALANNYNPDAIIDDGSCAFGGNVQDCIGAKIICNQNFPEDSSYSSDPINTDMNGDIPEEVPNSSCLGTGEKNSVWYKFTSHESGDLGFTIFPNNLMDDYDWAVYDITDFGCEGIPTEDSPELSCNYSGQTDCDGATGPNGETSGPCANQNEDLILVDSGSTYAIVVSQFENSSQDGFNIAFDTASVIYTAQMETQDFTACSGDSIELSLVSFTASELGEQQYKWYLEDSSWISYEEKPISFVLDSTVYVWVSVKDRDCELKDSIRIEVGKLEANFGWEFEDNGFPNPVTFTDSSEGATTLTWIFGDSTDEEVTQPEIIFDHEYQEPGYYDVMQVAYNEVNECIDTVTILVPMPFVLPNIITPNGDGINDVFIIKGLRRYSTLFVFNRWGKQVYKVDDEYDGTWDGGDLPDGQYFYVVKEPGSKGEDYAGWLEIKR